MRSIATDHSTIATDEATTLNLLVTAKGFEQCIERMPRPRSAELAPYFHRLMARAV